MSTGVVLDPVLSRSGSTKIAQPAAITTVGAVLEPVCRQFSGSQTATPGVVGAQ